MRANPTVTHVATGGFGLIGGSYNTTSLIGSTMGVNGGRFISAIDATLAVEQFAQGGLPCTLDSEI